MDGSVLGTLVANGDSNPVPPTSIVSKLELRMVEAGVNGDGIADTLRAMHWHLTNVVFPMSFLCYERMLNEATPSQ